ncbi:MAG: efflux RND transporter periplasmic adaptor subunit [Opitutaceae bacterium]
MIAVAIVVGLAIVVLLVAASRRSKKGLPVTVERAQRRTITQLVTATGKIQPEVEVKISPEVYGEITELPFREGMRVRKGQLIVRIKPDMYQAQVDQQTAAVASARGAAMVAEAQLEKAAQDLRRYDDLYRRGLASASDELSYRTAYDVAKAQDASAKANVAQAEGFLKQAKDQLSKTCIYAPMDGTVSSRSSEVGERVVATGEFTGTEIMRIADLSTMEVEVDVNEDDIPNVKVGDRADIDIDAYPDRKFSGLVKEIASSAENAGGSGSGSSAQASGSSSNEVTNFLVKIRLADPGVELRPGMSATADIETQTAANVVAVPIQSVTVRAAGGLTSDQVRAREAKATREKSGNELTAVDERTQARRDRGEFQRVVFVVEGGKARLRRVETGIADDTWIEVKSGVEPGQEVVSGTYAAISRILKDGMEVRVDRTPGGPGA